MVLHPSAEATRRDLRLVAWVLLLIELVIAGLTVVAGRFAGRQAALVVGLGFSALAILALFLLVGLCFLMAWLTDRPRRKP
jgi:hypothetical protein